MAQLIHLPNLRHGYVDLVNQVIESGHQSAPRNLPIIELNDVTFTIDDVSDTLPVGVGRDLNLKIAAVEALQLIAAQVRPSLMVAASPAFANYMEPDGTFWGSYGDRISNQVYHIIDKLTRDPDSRQAIVTFWNHPRDNNPSKRDYPCTIALGFRIRRDMLDLSVTMRSNDLWLGTAYDVFQFTQLQHVIAHELGVDTGTYTHTAWSLHVYERDLAKCAVLHDPRSGIQPSIPRGFETDAESPSYYEIARDLLDNPALYSDESWGDSISWYRKQMEKIHENTYLQ